jgi:hypothetical protein
MVAYACIPRTWGWGAVLKQEEHKIQDQHGLHIETLSQNNNNNNNNN